MPRPGTRQSPCGTLGMGRESGAILWAPSTGGVAEGPRPHVLAGMATRRGQEKLLSAALSPARRSEPRHAMAARVAQPWGRRGFAPPNRRLKTGGKTQPG